MKIQVSLAKIPTFVLNPLYDAILWTISFWCLSQFRNESVYFWQWRAKKWRNLQNIKQFKLWKNTSWKIQPLFGL